MAQEKGSLYNAPDPCTDSLEKMNKRLTADLRVRIRRLGHFTPGSPDWLDMTDALQHLASVAAMEAKDCAKKGGSIWEREELCVRYIVEEGKINMLLRSMHEFKTFQYNAQKEGGVQEELASRMAAFEINLGILLKHAFTAVEALQTLDVTNLIEHCTAVLNNALSAPESVTEPNVQEMLVISYLESVVNHVEQLNEETVMGQMESQEIVPLVLRHYEAIGSKSEKSQQAAYVNFLAHLMETEFYQTHRAKFVPDKPAKERLALFEALTKEMMAADPAQRKLYRCLSDNIIRFK